MASINTLISGLETAQHDKGETLYVNDAGQFTTAKKGLFSWIGKSSKGFNNNALTVAAKISETVKAMQDAGTLTPADAIKLSAALTKWQARILKAKKVETRNARTQALAGAFVVLGAYGQVPDSPLFNGPASTVVGSLSSRSSPAPSRFHSPSPRAVSSPSNSVDGSPRDFRSIPPMNLPAPLQHVAPQAAEDSQPLSNFETWLDAAAQSCGREYGFGPFTLRQVKENAQGRFPPGSGVTEEMVQRVVSEAAREAATEEHMAVWRDEIIYQVNAKYGEIVFPRGSIIDLAQSAKTKREFSDRVYALADRLAKDKLARVFDAVCVGAGIIPENLSFNQEKAEIQRIFDLEERVISYIQTDCPNSYLMNHLHADPNFLRRFLVSHFAEREELSLRELEIFLSKHHGLNERPFREAMKPLFPEGVFKMPRGLISPDLKNGYSAPRSFYGDEGRFGIKENGPESATGRSVESFAPLVQEDYFAPSRTRIYLSPAVKEALAKRQRAALLEKQTEALSRRRIGFGQQVQYLIPQTEAQIREVWTGVLIEEAEERVLGKRLPPEARVALRDVILALAQRKPIEELGRIAREEIEKLK